MQSFIMQNYTKKNYNFATLKNEKRKYWCKKNENQT